MKSKLLVKYIAIFVVTLCATVFSSCVTENAPDNIGVGTGDMLPQFSVCLDNGEIVSSSSLIGKIAVIEFFNTGCRDCQQGLPAINQLYEAYQENPEVVIFGISREENSESIEEFWGNNNFSLPYSPQPDRIIYNLFATMGIPRTFIADETGKIIVTFGDSDIPTFSDLHKILQNEISNFKTQNSNLKPDTHRMHKEQLRDNAPLYPEEAPQLSSLRSPLF